MKFIADLHVHSKFSRATSKSLDLESLYTAARIKGIDLVGTGDFTHPGWFAELKEKLVPAEQGLFKLRDDIERTCEMHLPVNFPGRVRFMLVCEISNIYKKKERVRKNHNLVFAPDLALCETFNHRLSQIGNIASDGRPILGLDARDLLEIVLHTSEENFLIPAHIWTPWFSVLGSKSGFDSIGDCFEDLSDHIFAVETGLSSDPAMNWMVSDLDGLSLVSNSDAHSAAKLGREANWFDTKLDYFSIREALKSPDSEHFLGTFEFFAEEGKYHFDGHRKCGVCCSPTETAAVDGKCPVCGKPLTRGVLNRVMALADRRPGERPGSHARPYYSLIPLCDILSVIFRVGSNTKTVRKWYHRALSKLGSEFDILHHKKIEDIEKGGIPLLAAAVERMRSGKIDISPGYDGEFGRIRIFKDHERQTLMGQNSLFAAGNTVKKNKSIGKKSDWRCPEKLPRPPVKRVLAAEKRPRTSIPAASDSPLEGLNAAQREAVLIEEGFLLIVAGPGTGKTRTLTHKMAFLLTEKQVLPENMLALTFTNRAADEMRGRVGKFIKKKTAMPLVTTFHGFCRQLQQNSAENLIDAQEQRLWVKEAVEAVRRKKEGDIPGTVNDLQRQIMSAKQRIMTPGDLLSQSPQDLKVQLAAETYQAYQEILSSQGLIDFEDLIYNMVRRLENDRTFRRRCRKRFRYFFIDEYQDINHGQYRLVKFLSHGARHLCAIGDPNQSIYGFRGSQVGYFTNFLKDYPRAAVIRLTKNYRSTQTILAAAGQVVNGSSFNPAATAKITPGFRGNRGTDGDINSDIKGYAWIDVIETASGRSEAVAVGKVIEEMVGGMSLHAIDAGKIKRMHRLRQYGFSDFAVLYRTGEQGRVLSKVFTTAGIPHQVASRSSRLTRPGIGELISLLKAADQRASLFDLEKISRLHPWAHAISLESWLNFRTWCYRQKIPLKDCLRQVRRFRLPDINTRQQRCLDEFIKDLEVLRERLAGQSLRKKLEALMTCETYPQLRVLIEEDPESLEIYQQLLEQADPAEFKAQPFLADMALKSDTDMFVAGIEKVALMSMHAAKGLEFPVVFITGCENGYIPYHREGAVSDPHEERRLFYVALTRARERLFLTLAAKRRIYGKWEQRNASAFIAAIEPGLRRHRRAPRQEKPGAHQVQLKLF